MLKHASSGTRLRFRRFTAASPYIETCSYLLSIVLLLMRGNAGAQVQITEFMADNETTLRDDFGDYPDWIELWNSSTNTVNLLDWALTDSTKKMREWVFPSTNLPPNACLVVFASGRDRRTPGAPLHTNFKLDTGGEYLALVRPDGTVATEFAPAFPRQMADVSYGFGWQAATNLVVSTNSTGRVLVPGSNQQGLSWTAVAFDDSGWTFATNGIGFETGASEDPATVPAAMIADNPAGYWRLNEANGTTATNSGWILGTGDGQYLGSVVAGIPGPSAPAFGGFETNNLAVRITGTNHIEIPFTPDLNPSGPFTLEAWVKPSRAGVSGTTGCPVASLNVNGSARNGYAFYQDYDALNKWEFILGNNSGYIARATGGAVDTNRWQYLAGVYDGSKARLYVNGLPVATNTLSGSFAANTTQKLTLGGRINVSPYSYAGDLDEVSLLSRALSASEVSNRFQLALLGLPQTNYNYTPFIRTDLRGAMFNSNATAYLRLPFTLTNAADCNMLTLRLRYDDGFAAFLNGVQVVADNAPDTLAWNSIATARRPTADAALFRTIDLSAFAGYLQEGTNVLAIQGLNIATNNPDFLLQAELATGQMQYSTDARYFVQPSPGAVNSIGLKDLGPIFVDEGFSPALPGTNDSLTVTCRLTQAFAPITSVMLNWRVMYNSIQQTPMYDDGLHGDGAAGDGIYGATIPSQSGTNSTYTAGQMVRWYVTATDSQSRTSRWPMFLDATVSAEYDGTVIQADYVTSALPVFHLFVDPANYSGMDSESGARGSFYYDGEFYDNIYLEVRGNSTAGYAKKSHRLEFNDEHQLRHPGPGGRVGKTSLLCEYMDPSYLRQYLSLWLQAQAGVPGPFDYPVRVQRNGQFYQLAFHSDVPGREQLGRLGYDQDGALYKTAGTIVTSHSSSGGFDKLLPKTNGVVVASTADFDALATAIDSNLSTGQRKTNAFDMLNLPEVINYLAVARFTQEGDDVWANMTLYRDTYGSGEWSIIPYDVNLSWGQLYYGNYPAQYGVINVTNDFYKSHPLYGGSQVQEHGSASWNRMYDVVIAVPETRQMLLRRMRTLMDTWIQPPGTPAGQGIIEQLITSVTNAIGPEAQIDRQVWGWPPNGGAYGWGSGLWLSNGVSGLFDQFLAPRRAHFYGTHCETNTAKPIGLTWTNNAGIPTSQATNALIQFAGLDYNPASRNQDEEYVCLTNANAYAVDVSGWTVSGGITHQFKPGTVIPATSVIYLSPNVVAFRARAAAPYGGMGLFVQGNYDGHLSAWGETLTLADTTGRMIATNSYVGTPSLAQRYLRITEIMYNPSPAPAITNDAQQFEYLELKNVSTDTPLDLTGVQITEGVYFTFTGSAVTNLAPGQTVLVARNRAAFSARYGTGFTTAGEYSGALDNAGETLRLQDAEGEKILEFSYDNSWYPITDGLGFSLVIVDATASWDTWGLKSSWRASGRINGSPGSDDVLPTPPPAILITEALTHSDPNSDWVELYNPGPTSADIGGWLLTDDFYNPTRYRIPANTVIAPNGFLVLVGANTFELGTNGFRLSEYGEEVYLFSADSATNLTGYYHGFDFGAAPNNVSYGRYVNSQGLEDFVLQSAQTPGQTNAGPRVGPLVISEIMYHPPGLTNDALNEFVELQNLSTEVVLLYDTYTNEVGYGNQAVTNTWRLGGGLTYDFPTNMSLPPAGRLLVVSFDPVANPEQLAAFETRFNVSSNSLVCGPWTGHLNNAGDSIQLHAPDKPDVSASGVIIPYVMMEKVDYLPVAPWPTAADGLGSSLQRLVLHGYANDPINWVAAPPTAGQINACAPPPVISSLSGQPGGVDLCVPSSPGYLYRLEYKDDLTTPDWTFLPPLLPGDGSMLMLTDTNRPASQRFYRLRLE